jgi:hypothetical protein
MSKKDTLKEMENLEELSTVEIQEVSKFQEIEDIQDVIPQMNVNVPMPEMINFEDEKVSIVSDEQLVGLYVEILDCIRDDRQQVSTFIDTVAEMVINDGDATSSSKEALVNLVKIKSDITDKMTKVADLMTRVKLKEKDTFPKYLAANQNNTININEGGSRRSLIEAINKAKKNKEKNA